ncbi:MAG: alginate export family protein [Pseudomonadota bacterium]|nr:alginate export family protein [Pseudomonadota bacterium]
MSKRFVTASVVFFFIAVLIPRYVWADNSLEPLLEKSVVETPVLDSAALPPLAFQLTPWLALGTSLKLTLESGDNVNVVGGAPARQRASESVFTVVSTLSFAPNVGLFTAAELIRHKKTDRGFKTHSGVTAAYLMWNQMLSLPLTLQVGRQRFSDARQWLFDENLDGVRLQLKLGRLVNEISASTYINPKSDKEALENYLLRSDYHFTTRNELGVYALYRKDPVNEKSDRTYLGMSGEARLYGHNLWLEMTSLSGENGSRQRQSFAVDTGVTLRLGADRQWSITLAHALGSGDSNSRDDLDKTFRQTGLDDNEARFNGITKFKYYGVVTDPELSNLRVATVGIGWGAKRKHSVDLVYHAYEQIIESSRFRSKVIQAPNGKARQLGTEIDLILGVRMNQNFVLQGSAGLFQPGAGFDNSESVVFGELQLKFTATSPAPPLASAQPVVQRTPIKAYPPPPRE